MSSNLFDTFSFIIAALKGPLLEKLCFFSGDFA